MLLPAIQYGDWATVKGRMRKVVTQLKRGANLIEMMTQDGMLDTTEHPGMLVMNGIVLGTTSNFHCFAPWRLAWDVLFDARSDPITPTSVEEAIFSASLDVSWGILGLLSRDNEGWLISRGRCEALLHAALAVWDEFDAVGPRYCWSTPERLWTLPNNLHYALGKMGVPNDMLRSPLPPEGPRALLRYARLMVQE